MKTPIIALLAFFMANPNIRLASDVNQQLGYVAPNSEWRYGGTIRFEAGMDAQG
jgi:hypothetical protein